MFVIWQDNETSVFLGTFLFLSGSLIMNGQSIKKSLAEVSRCPHLQVIKESDSCRRKLRTLRRRKLPIESCPKRFRVAISLTFWLLKNQVTWALESDTAVSKTASLCSGTVTSVSGLVKAALIV